MPQTLQPQQLAERLQRGDDVYLIDVRRPWEHELASLPGSLLIPLQELPQRLTEVQPPAGVAVVCYCHHGVRSWTAALVLEAHGFDNVMSLTGGIDAWSLLIDPRVPRY